ncbi:SUMF1/EgtB/PvdO family nonheme iron enzyme [Prevotella sp. P5-92]|uniref:SUMF1/EgtB/PvdO family nonheme iron enzyme n=1 Tax=Prevotella sp. P5-92 TaxID=2024222 RepID=UPI000B96A910|nr:SUMF1/EgtB/PvdO family nonheme iron enzyme [Prevotella sp. P5-92]
MKQILLTLIFYLCATLSHAQKLTTESFEYIPNDLVARTEPRTDLNGRPCAVIRVGIALQGVVFDGNTIGSPKYNTGEYLVYITNGSRQITIRHDSFLPLTVTFADYGIERVESGNVYRLTVLTGTPPAPQLSQGNFLVMNVTPASSRVSIDNGEPRDVNSDGSLKVYLENGNHTYKVEADGYLSQTGFVNMTGARQQQNIKLKSTKASLTVKTSTSGSQIYINEDYKGIDNWNGELTPGIYLVEARKDGYCSASTTVALAKQQTETVTLPALQQIFGSLMVDYEPVDADIYMDNRLLGKTPNVFSNIAVGKHSIKISKAGYADYAGSVTIQENQQASINGSLRRSDSTSSSLSSVNNSSASGSVVPITVNGVTFNMIKVDGGTFTMGATQEQENPDRDENPTHQVTLSTYYIGETEVTQALWKTVMGSNPSNYRGDNLPVESVSWNDCQDFLLKLYSQTGKIFRLPTEAEWEFAARGGNKRNGTQYSGSSNIDEVAWYDGNSGNKTHPVKTKKANELGIYDMSGNVWEWCQDWYGNYKSNAKANPIGPSSGVYRGYRGGGWSNFAWRCRSARRDSSSPDYSHYSLGLRLVLSE